jgi:energy-coupling factor transporter transmembrane protein EcfT
VNEVLARLGQPRLLFAEFLGVIGALFVAAVGVGVVVAQLGRNGKVGLFSMTLVFALLGFASWSVYLGRSFRRRLRATPNGQVLERGGILGFRELVTIPNETTELWLLSGDETDPRYLLFRSMNGWESLPVDFPCRALSDD